MFPVALSDSFRAAKRLWDSSNVIETVAGHAGEQRLHIMCALGLNVLANFGKPVTAKGHVPSPFIIKVPPCGQRTDRPVNFLLKHYSDWAAGTVLARRDGLFGRSQYNS